MPDERLTTGERIATVASLVLCAAVFGLASVWLFYGPQGLVRVRDMVMPWL